MADDDKKKSATLSYVVVTDDENHENHEIMCDMSTPKLTPNAVVCTRSKKSVAVTPFPSTLGGW